MNIYLQKQEFTRVLGTLPLLGEIGEMMLRTRCVFQHVGQGATYVSILRCDT